MKAWLPKGLPAAEQRNRPATVEALQLANSGRAM